MPRLEMEFSVYCGECGARLCFNTRVDKSNVTVDPCANCLAKVKAEGYDEGYADAGTEYDAAYQDGYNDALGDI